MYFHEWKLLYLIRISLKCIPQGLINDKSATDSGNGLATNRQQAIVWRNADPVHGCVNAGVGGDKLNYFKLITNWAFNDVSFSRCHFLIWCLLMKSTRRINWRVLYSHSQVDNNNRLKGPSQTCNWNGICVEYMMILKAGEWSVENGLTCDLNYD